MANPFVIKIEFTGLCLFVKRKNGAGVTVLMPDARRDPDPNVTYKHPDNSDAEPHAGYLRFDAANLPGLGHLVGPHGARDPEYEVVQRFKGAEVGLGQTKKEPVDDSLLKIPDFNEFAPVKQVQSSMLAPKPKMLLARIDLQGGKLESVDIPPQLWNISNELGKAVSKEKYGGVVEWTSPEITDKENLAVTVTEFAGKTFEVTLEPTDATATEPRQVFLRMANLCFKNPLEWKELPEQLIATDDVDFKWLYQLLELKADADPRKYPASAVPHPKPIKTAEQGMLSDCFSGKIDE